METCENCRFWKRWPKPNQWVTHTHGDCWIKLPRWVSENKGLRHTEQDDTCDLWQTRR